ncbi:MAG TPA: hypothetical protein PK453_26825, partial [Leptospiraceae bacterium]|nr:hypothetical protein [Leptospiraceae bacterium]
TMDRDTTAEVTFNSYAVTVVQGYSAALQKLKSESPKEWHDNAVTGADSIVKMLNERNAVSTKHLPVIKKKSAKSKEISAKHRKNAVAFRDSFQYDKAKTEFTSAASYNSTDPFHKEITAMDLHLQSKSAAGWDKTSLLREAMLNDQDNKPIQKDSQPIISSYKAKGDQCSGGGYHGCSAFYYYLASSFYTGNNHGLKSLYSSAQNSAANEKLIGLTVKASKHDSHTGRVLEKSISKLQKGGDFFSYGAAGTHSIELMFEIDASKVDSRDEPEISEPKFAAEVATGKQISNPEKEKKSAALDSARYALNAAENNLDNADPYKRTSQSDVNSKRRALDSAIQSYDNTPLLIEERKNAIYHEKTTVQKATAIVEGSVQMRGMSGKSPLEPFYASIENKALAYSHPSDGHCEKTGANCPRAGIKTAKLTSHELNDKATSKAGDEIADQMIIPYINRKLESFTEDATANSNENDFLHKYIRLGLHCGECQENASRKISTKVNPIPSSEVTKFFSGYAGKRGSTASRTVAGTSALRSASSESRKWKCSGTCNILLPKLFWGVTYLEASSKSQADADCNSLCNTNCAKMFSAPYDSCHKSEVE